MAPTMISYAGGPSAAAEMNEGQAKVEAQFARLQKVIVQVKQSLLNGKQKHRARELFMLHVFLFKFINVTLIIFIL